MTLCLAIETSCDETAVSLLTSRSGQIEILVEEISSQTSIHEQYGGVVPELASREHLAALPLMLSATLQKARVSLQDLDLIAVTKGPGLKGCLLIGIGVAKGVALAAKKPLLGVHHIEGHLHSPRIVHPELSYPYLALVVSGGHTEIVLVEGLARYRVLSRTKDDAAGEAFDKAANLLGITYPGGAALAALADRYLENHCGIIPKELALPKVMRGSADFSFSGLKTAVVLLLKREQQALSDPERRGALAASIQDAIVEALISKVEEVVRQTGISRVALCGGVSANRRLRKRAAEISGVTLFLPSKLHCMDNASMIGFVGLEHFQAGVKGSLALHVRSSWPVEEVGALCG